MYATLMLFIFIVFFWILCNTLKTRRIHSMLSNLEEPPGFPIIGSAFTCICTRKVFLKRVLRVMKKYKSPVKFFLFGIPYVGVYSPEDIQLVNTKCLKKDETFCMISDLLGNGLLTANGEKWKRSRRIMNPIFNLSVLSKSFLEIFNKQTLQLIQQLKLEANTECYFDLWPHIFKCAFSTILESSMGYCGEVDDADFRTMRISLEKASSLIAQRIFQPWLRPTFIFKIYMFLIGYSDVITNFKRLPQKILEKARKDFNENKKNGGQKSVDEKSSKTMIDVLLDIAKVEDSLTNDEITDEVTTIFFAGSETTTITICHVLLMFAIRQDIQDQVYAELHEVFGNSDQLPTMENISQLNYLEQCIKESLRRVSVAPGSIRHLSQDIVLSNGTTVPAGMSILTSYIGVHMDEKLYPDPYRWNPSNFDPEKIASRPNGSFCPFGAGPRLCVGYKYAMLAMKAQLALLLRNFKLSTDLKEEELEFNIDILVRSAIPYRVKLHYRHDKSLF